MINLISYEIKKIFKFQNMLLIMAFFLLFNVIFLYYQEINKYRDPFYYRDLYREKIDHYSFLNEQELERQIQDDLEEANIVITLAGNEPGTDYYNDILNEYSENNPELLRSYLDGEIEFKVDEASLLVQVIGDISKDINNIDNFSSNVQGIIDQSNSMSSISIFQNSSESISNIKKTGYDYANIADVIPIFGDHLAIKSFLSEKYTYVFILTLMFMAVFALSVNETNMSMSLLISSTKNGNCLSILAKIIALILFLFGICIVFYLTNIVFFNVVYGFDNLFDPIQSISGFDNFTWCLNGVETMIVMVFYRFLTICAMTLIVFALLTMLPMPIVDGAIILASIIIEALFYHLIPITSSLGILRYLNIFTVFDLNFTLFQYHNIVLCDLVFGLKEMTITGMIVLIVVSIVISLCFHRQASPHHNRKSVRKINVSKHTSILLHELYKSLFHNKGIIVLLILGLYFVNSLDSYQGVIKNVGYENLVKEYGGAIDEDKIEEINAYRNELEQYILEAEELEERFENNEISIDEYYSTSSLLNSEITKGNYLYYLEDSINNSKGNNRGIVFEDGFNLLFDYGLNNNKLNGVIVNFLVIAIALILCISPIAVNDKIKNSDVLYTYTVFNQKRFEAKQLIVVIYCILITLIFAVWKYVAINNCFDLSYGEFGFGSIYALSGLFNVNISLYAGYIIASIIRCIILIFMGEVVLLISNYCNSLLSTIVFSSIILLAPVLLLFFNVGSIDRILLIEYFINYNAYILDLFFFLKLGAIVLITMMIGYINLKGKCH